jgi:hypothetical protein
MLTLVPSKYFEEATPAYQQTTTTLARVPTHRARNTSPIPNEKVHAPCPVFPGSATYSKYASDIIKRVSNQPACNRVLSEGSSLASSALKNDTGGLSDSNKICVTSAKDTDFVVRRIGHNCYNQFQYSELQCVPPHLTPVSSMEPPRGILVMPSTGMVKDDLSTWLAGSRRISRLPLGYGSCVPPPSIKIPPEPSGFVCVDLEAAPSLSDTVAARLLHNHADDLQHWVESCARNHYALELSDNSSDPVSEGISSTVASNCALEDVDSINQPCFVNQPSRWQHHISSSCRPIKLGPRYDGPLSPNIDVHVRSTPKPEPCSTMMLDPKVEQKNGIPSVKESGMII